MADVASAIRRLFDSQKYADLTIRCDGAVLRLHCCVVCTRSKVFAAMIDGQFKEAILREIDLPDDELLVVAAMIRYLYTDDYDDTAGVSNIRSGMKLDMLHDTKASTELFDIEPFPEPPDSSPAMVFNVKVYIAADKYDIPGLKALAAQKFLDVAIEFWNSVEFSEAAQLLWDNIVASDRLLKDIVVGIASDNIRTALDRGEFVELLSSRGELCLEVLNKVLCRDPLIYE